MVRFNDNDFFKELIEDAITNQDIENSFNSCLYNVLEERLENCPDDLIDALHDLILDGVKYEYGL